ncbi:MAG: hypothetical protein AABX63_05070 [Nanoarchaeota archaeon]
MKYFYDSYAVIEYINDNPKFARYFEENAGSLAITNVMEIYYSSLLEAGVEKANIIIEGLWPLIIHPTKETVKKAMQFRAKQKKRKMSYADCIGYILALENKIIFLTGDKEFRDMPNVEFVK